MLRIYHIDVGQGDSTLVVSPSGRTLLVDGGDRGRGTRQVVPILQALRITALDYTVASHYDADHIGGMDEAIRSLPGRIRITAFDRGESHDTDAFEEYIEAVGDKRKTISIGERIDMGEEIEVVCVAVNQRALDIHSDEPREVEEERDDENGDSIALVVRFGEFDYFIGGDLTGGGRSGSRRTPDVETPAAQAVGDVDVLRISHHGSNTSSNETFLQGLRAEVAIISVGSSGKTRLFGHPRREVLTRLRDLVSLKRIFMTNQGGTKEGLKPEELAVMKIADDNVVVTTDGRSYTVNGSVFATDGVNSSLPLPQPGD